MITSRALQSGLIAPAPPGPPPTSGTRDALGEGVMQNGCNSFSGIKALKDRNEARDLKVGNSLREAGACLKASENDLLIVQKRVVNPTSPGNRRPEFPEVGGRVRACRNPATSPTAGVGWVPLTAAKAATVRKSGSKERNVAQACDPGCRGWLAGAASSLRASAGPGRAGAHRGQRRGPFALLQ